MAWDQDRAWTVRCEKYSKQLTVQLRLLAMSADPKLAGYAGLFSIPVPRDLPRVEASGWGALAAPEESPEERELREFRAWKAAQAAKAAAPAPTPAPSHWPSLEELEHKAQLRKARVEILESRGWDEASNWGDDTIQDYLDSGVVNDEDSEEMTAESMAAMLADNDF